jgi:hypothetical protein
MIPILPERSRVPEANSCHPLTRPPQPLLVGRPERVVGPAKVGCAVSCTLVRVRSKRIDKCRKGSGHILWNVVRSFRPPGRAGINGSDVISVTGLGYRA